MKASFFKRILAFALDYFIVALFLSLITVGFNMNNNKYNDKIKDVMNDYKNGDITAEKYAEEVVNIEYDIQKSNLPVNGVSSALFIGYFIIFGYLNKGQTLGKKIFKIKVVNKDGERVGFGNILLRSLFIYGILSSLFSIACVLFFNVNVFSYGYKIIGTIETIILFVSFFMVLYKKDGRGLHDLIGGTNVVEEVK